MDDVDLDVEPSEEDAPKTDAARMSAVCTYGLIRVYTVRMSRTHYACSSSMFIPGRNKISLQSRPPPPLTRAVQASAWRGRCVGDMEMESIEHDCTRGVVVSSGPRNHEIGCHLSAHGGVQLAHASWCIVTA
jgi:hypothetical protein